MEWNGAFADVMTQDDGRQGTFGGVKQRLLRRGKGAPLPRKEGEKRSTFKYDPGGWDVNTAP
jgi:hypothetical protein